MELKAKSLVIDLAPKEVVKRMPTAMVPLYECIPFIKQLLQQQRDDILKMIDEMIKELRDDNHERNYLVSKDERRKQIKILTELKQKIEG